MAATPSPPRDRDRSEAPPLAGDPRLEHLANALGSPEHVGVGGVGGQHDRIEHVAGGDAHAVAERIAQPRDLPQSPLRHERPLPLLLEGLVDHRSGAIQTAWNIPPAQLDALDAEPDPEAIRAVTVGFDELGFNCADKSVYPKSTGHPVLQDPAFRSALQWAVDKERLVMLAYGDNAAGGGEYAPDFDMFLWSWGGDVDPNFILSVLTTGAIESWSDCNWSNAEYDRLFREQQTTIDLQERIALVHRMQQIVYEESPYIPLVYPKDVECANTGAWTGWVRANEGEGAWWYNTLPDSYVAVHPREGAEGAGGDRHTGLIVGLVAAAIVTVLIVALALRERRGRSEVE